MFGYSYYLLYLCAAIQFLRRQNLATGKQVESESKFEPFDLLEHNK